MRFISLVAAIFTLAASSSNYAANDPTPLDQPIATLRLTNGTVLRNVSVVRYDKERVVLRSSGGLGPIAYSYIPEPVRSQMLALRDAELKRRAAEAESKAADSAKPLDITGEVFVVTRGRDNVRLGDTAIVAYPLNAARSALEFSRPVMPAPVASTRTDADGGFRFKLRREDLPVLITAEASRLVGRTTERYIWRVSSEDAPDLNHVVLTNSNMLDGD